MIVFLIEGSYNHEVQLLLPTPPILMNYSLWLKQENYLESKGILIQEITFPPCCPN
jgi:hypothetical protein